MTAPEQAIIIYTFWLMVFTGFLGIATILLTFFTAHLAISGKKSAKQQLRAYVSDVKGTAEVGQTISVVLELKNSGQTPAYGVEIFCELPVIARHDARPFNQKPKFAPIKTIIGAGSEFEVTRWLPNVSPEGLALLRNHTNSLFVWGRVNYIDAFKERRFFVFRCIALGPTRTSPDIWPLVPHPDGYEAD